MTGERKPPTQGPGDAHGQARQQLLLQAMPVVFVLIWSTGFVVARLGMPHAPPMGFLALRYALSIAAFMLWILWSRAVWPAQRQQWWHLLFTGVLMHAGYLGGVWVAVKGGLGAGMVALIIGFQPLLTALWVSARNGAGQVPMRLWIGLALGLVGLVLVVASKLGVGEAQPVNFVWAVLALACITTGTLYQKRWVAPCDVRTANTVQLLGALAVTAPLALLETEAMVWHPDLVLAMSWSVLVLTLGGSSLLYLLIQRGAATVVTSLMYLVPPCTALMAAALFGEALTPAVLAGLGLTAAGVAMVVHAGRRVPVV
jgi:drug/metabolite transporter (DMT)-like permease